MYYKVPIVSGVLDIDYELLIEAHTLSLTEAVVRLAERAKKRETWTEITEVEYLAAFSAGKLVTDKFIIKSDSLDTATIIAKVHPGLTEITFYHTDTNEPIATVEVDPENYTATLQVTTTSPGAIRIRAGRPTMTRLNEVEVIAK